MSHRDGMRRREFIPASAVGAGLGLSPEASGQSSAAVERAARAAGRLPRRRLGSSTREISVLVGAGTWDAGAVEAGIRCGINFWHKASAWTWGGAPPVIIKNRDAYYCQVCVDRVRGNHETGQIDEQQHYEYVKDAAKRTELRYFDDMQFHFGYHSVAEIRNNRGIIRAFERLKKEGMVHHLCLSQHSYNGNSRVRGGQSASEILAAVIEDGSYEHAQFIYSYGDDKATNDFVALAKKKGFVSPWVTSSKCNAW